MKKIIATTALVATAAGTAVLVAAPANADVERRGTCAGASFELSVDRERGGYDVDADIENAKAYSSWRVTVRHDGCRRRPAHPARRRRGRARPRHLPPQHRRQGHLHADGAARRGRRLLDEGDRGLTARSRRAGARVRPSAT